MAEDRKRSKYTYLSNTYHFIPVVFETLGAFGPLAVKFIKDIGNRITSASGEKRATTFLFQRLGIAVQRGNAASILATLPTDGCLQELNYITL